MVHSREIILGTLLTVSIGDLRAEPRALEDRSYKEIIDNYSIIADFSVKPEVRPISEKLFWKYPYKLPLPEFKIDFEIDPDIDLPASKGAGRAVEHLNVGRQLLLEGKNEEAKAVFLSSRARYGDEHEFHRRNDYYIAQAFLALAKEELSKPGANYSSELVRNHFSNANTFLSWAFQNKKNFPDPMVEKQSPKSLYNLAAIRFNYKKYGGSFAAANMGLNYLRKTGRKDKRSNLRALIAEAYIKNGSYLEAVQELDKAIRLDGKPEDVGDYFSRLGDIYFNLNNYALAEDMYALSIAVDRSQKKYRRMQMILRAESLFWMGRFDKALKVFDFALEGVSVRPNERPVPSNIIHFGHLRKADTFLAAGDPEQAKLEYYKVEHRYPKSEVAKIAKIRRACLESEEYGVKNVKHMREDLHRFKTDELTSQTIEMAWACDALSYTYHEKNHAMLDKVQDFVKNFPDSYYEKEFIEPIKSFQKERLFDFYNNGDYSAVVDYYEKNKEILFDEKISDDMLEALFVSYIQLFDVRSARELERKSLNLSRKYPILYSVYLAELTQDNRTPAILESNRLNIKRLVSNNFVLENGPDEKLAISRIISTPVGDQYAVWLMKSLATWTNPDYATVCSTYYPVLSKVKIDNNNRSDILVMIGEVIEANLPKLLDLRPECAKAYLDLEQQTYAVNKREYGNLFISRSYWPANKMLSPYLWQAAEGLKQIGEIALAESLWKRLRGDGYRDQKESKFAKMRLDKTRTEFEKIWD